MSASVIPLLSFMAFIGMHSRSEDIGRCRFSYNDDLYRNYTDLAKIDMGDNWDRFDFNNIYVRIYGNKIKISFSLKSGINALDPPDYVIYADECGKKVTRIRWEYFPGTGQNVTLHAF
jgi:hypothetical protein